MIDAFRFRFAAWLHPPGVTLKRGMAEWRNLPPNTKSRNGGIYPQTLKRGMAERRNAGIAPGKLRQEKKKPTENMAM